MRTTSIPDVYFTAPVAVGPFSEMTFAVCNKSQASPELTGATSSPWRSGSGSAAISALVSMLRRSAATVRTSPSTPITTKRRCGPGPADRRVHPGPYNANMNSTATSSSTTSYGYRHQRATQTIAVHGSGDRGRHGTRDDHADDRFVRARAAAPFCAAMETGAPPFVRAFPSPGRAPSSSQRATS